MRHFLKETDFSLQEAAEIFEWAQRFKAQRKQCPQALDRESWGLLFYKSSTRTRVSFEVGVHELGGQAVVLNAQQTQLGRGESTADTARVLGRYLQGLVIRTFEHSIVQAFAEHAGVPIVNGLTDFLHPCQLYTDLFTLLERWSPDGHIDLSALRGKKVAFLGDSASNMANSWILAAAYFGLELRLAGPKGFEPGSDIQQQLAEDGLEKNYHFTTDALEAASGADALYTDVWVSMGDEAEAQTRKERMLPYQVNAALMQAAKADAYFMHCLPAHAGEEVTQAVLDSPQSIIFDEAENRLHTQKAILAKLAELNAN